MEKVKNAVDSGFLFSTAVKENLGVRVNEFCALNKLDRPQFSLMLHGKRVPNAAQLAALTKAIGGSRQKWLDLWFATAHRRATLGR